MRSIANDSPFSQNKCSWKNIHDITCLGVFGAMQSIKLLLDASKTYLICQFFLRPTHKYLNKQCNELLNEGMLYNFRNCTATEGNERENKRAMPRFAPSAEGKRWTPSKVEGYIRAELSSFCLRFSLVSFKPNILKTCISNESHDNSAHCCSLYRTSFDRLMEHFLLPGIFSFFYDRFLMMTLTHVSDLAKVKSWPFSPLSQFSLKLPWIEEKHSNFSLNFSKADKPPILVVVPN